MTTPDTTVLIRGFLVTPRSREHWKARYESKGFTVHTPGYPGFDVEGRPHLMVAGVGWEEIADRALEWALAHADTTTPSTVEA